MRNNDNNPDNEVVKNQMKKMLSQIENDRSDKSNKGNIRTVSLKRHYEDFYPAEEIEENDNEDNMKSPMIPQEDKTEDLHKKINSAMDETLNYYKNRSKIVFASEQKEPSPINARNTMMTGQSKQSKSPIGGNNYNNFSTEQNRLNTSNGIPQQNEQPFLMTGNNSQSRMSKQPEQFTYESNQRQPPQFAYETNAQPSKVSTVRTRNSFDNNTIQNNTNMRKSSNVTNKSGVPSNKPISPRVSNRIPNTRSQNVTSQSKQIVVVIKPNTVSDFDISRDPINNNDMNVVPRFNFNKYSRNFIAQTSIALVGSGAILAFVIYTSEEEQRKKIIEAITSIRPCSWILGGMLIIGTIVLYLLYKKKQELEMYQEMAYEDYELLELRLNEMKDDEDFVGVFHSQFVKENSEKRKIPEGKYRKNVLPIINRFVKAKNQICEAELVISEQVQKIWRLNEDMKV